MDVKRQFINNLTELKTNHEQMQRALDRSGLKITDHFPGMSKERLVRNMQDVVAACEGLLRGDPLEPHYTRLERAVPDALLYLKRVHEAPQAKEHAALLAKVEQNVTFIKDNYCNI